MSSGRITKATIQHKTDAELAERRERVRAEIKQLEPPPAVKKPLPDLSVMVAFFKMRAGNTTPNTGAASILSRNTSSSTK